MEILSFPTAEQAPEASRLNALTVDVEDYFHVSGFDRCVDRADWDAMTPRVEVGARRLLDCLAEADVRGTFFILGWLAERQPDLVRAIHAAGHEIGCHSYAHRLIYEQTPEEFRRDLRRGVKVLQNIIGEPVVAYRVAEFLDHAKITVGSRHPRRGRRQGGFEHLPDASRPLRHPRNAVAPAPDRSVCRFSLWEFPPPVWRCLGYPLPVGGGGYFRLFPYLLTRLGLESINADGRPFAAYLHPWELDPEQPRFQPGMLSSFRHYLNLTRTEGRLRQMLRDFAFGTLSEALAGFAPSAAPVESARPMQRAAA